MGDDGDDIKSRWWDRACGEAQQQGRLWRNVCRGVSDKMQRPTEGAFHPAGAGPRSASGLERIWLGDEEEGSLEAENEKGPEGWTCLGRNPKGKRTHILSPLFFSFS